MPIDFPNSPNIGDIFTSGRKSFKWTGDKWSFDGGLQGIPGTQGVQGVQGVQGIQGMQSTQGVQGYDGIQGIQGNVGVQGSMGMVGPAGPAGCPARDGLQGPQGPAGASAPLSTSFGTAFGAPLGNYVKTDLTSNSLEQNGYQQFSNGLTLQWGQSKNISSSQIYYQDFNVPFSTTFTVLINQIIPQDLSNPFLAQTTVYLISASSSGFTWATNKINDQSLPSNIFWYAIGIKNTN